jgi:hypothetical protein
LEAVLEAQCLLIAAKSVVLSDPRPIGVVVAKLPPPATIAPPVIIVVVVVPVPVGAVLPPVMVVAVVPILVGPIVILVVVRQDRQRRPS